MTDPDLNDCGCAKDPYTGEQIIHIYKNNRARYDKSAKAYNQKYAMWFEK